MKFPQGCLTPVVAPGISLVKRSALPPVVE
ncbi:hypothetical protein PEC106568_04810 [Pectobacterium carotovorum subsp. carotovorum]|nr:hypothetical protein PEC106568_04810 [Pectobacterium carotovorum subsp. carotovorum]